MSVYDQIRSDFNRAGARASIKRLDRKSLRRLQHPMSIDVVSDEPDEYFDIQLSPDVQLAVVDVQPRQRHLLLSAWNAVGEDRFLCGHDEYHWFVAALPHESDALTVEAAMESLKPLLVKRLEERKHKGKHHRKSDVYMRQGEWFFLPCPHASIDRKQVSHGGMLHRGDSKPHHCTFLYEDGEREYECARYPKLAFFESEYKHILKTRRKAKQWGWRQLPFNPTLYAKGWIEHEDHSPLFLDIWHRVEMNRESDRLSMSRMIYRD
jgi:hypothetical protein